MKLGLVNHGGRAGICIDQRVYDLERDSGGTLSSDPMAALADSICLLRVFCVFFLFCR